MVTLSMGSKRKLAIKNAKTVAKTRTKSGTKSEIDTKIRKVLQDFPEIVFGILFGSQASGRASKQSDADIGIASIKPLSFDRKTRLSTKLNLALKKEVDIVDLQLAHGVILHQVLTTGRVVLNKKPEIYADIMKKMLYEQADFMPYYNRIIDARRKRFLGG